MRYIKFLTMIVLLAILAIATFGQPNVTLAQAPKGDFTGATGQCVTKGAAHLSMPVTVSQTKIEISNILGYAMTQEDSDCNIDLPVAMPIILDSVKGVVTIDGKVLDNNDGKSDTRANGIAIASAKNIKIAYSAGVFSNGFSIQTGDAPRGAKNATQNTWTYVFGKGHVYGQINGGIIVNPNPNVDLYFDGVSRGWMDDGFVRDLTVSGGRVWLNFGSPVKIVLNSVEGKIEMDGKVVTSGNCLRMTTKQVVVTYDANDGSNGLDYYLGNTAPKCLNYTDIAPVITAMGAITSVPTATMTSGGVMTVTATATMLPPTATLRPSPTATMTSRATATLVITATPTISATSTPTNTLALGMATGWCTANGQIYMLSWDGNKRTLYIPADMLTTLRDIDKTTIVPCSARFNGTGWLNAFGARTRIGEYSPEWNFPFPVNDPSLGFSIDMDPVP